MDFLHTRLLLRYANAGNRRLIVYRGGNLFYQVVVYPAGEGPPRYELRTTSARYATREPAVGQRGRTESSRSPGLRVPDGGW